MEEKSIDGDLAYAKKKIELARLDESEMSPVFQSLTFTEEQQDLYLLQLNPDIMDHLAEGQVLTIRGNPNETAVVCTDSRTYELKEAETSNSLLLLPNILWPDECKSGDTRVVSQKICGMFHNYFELRKCKPSFKKLRVVLESCAYKGKEYEDVAIKKYTIEDLLDFIQSSKQELEKALDDLHACVIDGYIRILDFEYKFGVLSHIVNVVESRSLTMSKVPKDVIVETLKDLVPKEITEKFFSWFSCETEEVDENGVRLYAFHEDSVCKMYAEVLLRAADKFHLNEFLESWQKSVPDGLTCNLTQLRGMALTDMNYQPEVIFYFPSDDMPEDVAERFAKLFKVKQKWSYEEILPYLEDRSVDVKSLLIKYARESIRDGIKLYNAKW